MHPTALPSHARSRRRTAAITAVLAVLGAMLTILFTAQPAAATHFRATSLTWHVTSGNTVEFHAGISYRCTAFFSSCPAVGATFNAEQIQFGDGTFSHSQWTVVSTNPANNVMNVEKHATHTYSGTGPYTARINSCCRLSPPLHVNNADDVVNAETIVNLATNHSPVSSIAPIVDCAKNSVCQFFVPAVDADSGESLRWRMAAPLEAGSSSFNQPGPPHAPSLAIIDASTGLYSWNTTGAQLNGSGDTYYSTQVIVENLIGSTVVSKIPVDFFIRLADGTSNQPPVFVSPTPADGQVINVNAGSPVTFDVKAEDPDLADTVSLTVAGVPAGATFTPSPGNPATGTFNWPAASGSSVILTLQAQDQNGVGATPRSITINVLSNQPPSADPGDAYTGNEGSAIAISGTATDPDATDTVATLWSVVGDPGNDAGADCVIADPSALSTSVTCDDDGLWTLTLAADDGNGGTDSEQVSLTVGNLNPSIDVVSPADWTVVPAGSPVTLATDVSDQGSNDALACTLDWGDTAPDSALCDDTHSYGVPGIYTITASVSDGDGGSASDTVRVVVYDPSAGFVTGGGTIDSPLGAFAADPTLTGQANFGFVSKYKRGATTPEGQTEFQFQTGGLNFHSSSYQWLVVAGTKAQFKGEGIVNGASGYSFMVTAVDGGKSGPDQFRIRIWGPGGTVYDNMLGDADDATPPNIKNGSVVIHK